MELLESGEIRLAFDDRARTLRRPKLGEYKKFRIASSAMFDDLPNDATAKIDEIMGRALHWWAEVGAVLSDEPFPTDEDAWPPWLANEKSVVDAIQHWRAVPLARGSKR